MPLSIKDPEADRLARAVAKATGETLTMAVVQSLRERLARVRPASQRRDLKIARRCAGLPVTDKRSAEEIIGHDEHGLPRQERQNMVVDASALVALLAGCRTLYSENLQHRQVIERTLTVINPFAKAQTRRLPRPGSG